MVNKISKYKKRQNIFQCEICYSKLDLKKNRIILETWDNKMILNRQITNFLKARQSTDQKKTDKISTRVGAHVRHEGRGGPPL